MPTFFEPAPLSLPSGRAVVAGLLALVLVSTPALGQEVSVTRGQLMQRFPGATDATLSSVTRGGVDTAGLQGSTITMDRDRFLTIRTGSDLEPAGRSALGPVDTAPEIGRLDVAGGASREAEREGRATADTVRPDPSQMAGERFVLPYRYLTADARGEDLWVLRPVFQTGGPLRYDPVEGDFRGSFYLAMEDSANRSESRPLRVPVHLRVLAETDTLAPEQLVFETTNFPLKQVRLASQRARDSVMVRIIPEFDLSGVELWLAVAPALVIETSPRTIQGMGIESAPVTVSVRGGTLREPVTVRFEADRGSFEPDVVTLEPGQSLAQVRVRSAGIGPASIRAFSPELGEARVDFRFGWPLPFLIAAVLGGLMGGLAAAVTGGGATGSRLRQALVRGVVLGVLAAIVYYAIGVSLLQVEVGVERFNEAAVFAFAALAGLLGLRLGPSSAPNPGGVH